MTTNFPQGSQPTTIICDQFLMILININISDRLSVSAIKYRLIGKSANSVIGASLKLGIPIKSSYLVE